VGRGGGGGGEECFHSLGMAMLSSAMISFALALAYAWVSKFQVRKGGLPSKA